MAAAFRRHPQDAARINLHEDWEMRYWSDRWGVPRREIVETAKRVGLQVKDIAQALCKDN
jgi:hypothetical protein